MMPITILLADDHHAVRAGLRLLLETQADFRVTGEAANGIETVRVAEVVRPTVIITDLMMPGIDGVEVTRQVRRRAPQCRILILSAYAQEAYVLAALRQGAAGYVLKGASVDELVYAIREVAAGRHYLSPPLSEYAIDAFLRQAHTAAFDPYESLSTREREVFQLAAHGHTTSAIAAQLRVSSRTVEMHRTNLMRKLGLPTQMDLIPYARRRGLLPPEP
jgi:two-component system, NarL family, response regulator NreC